MQSDFQTETFSELSPALITGRCYCGRCRLSASKAPKAATYCHCSDCKRASGAPVAAFAAFAMSDVKITPGLDRPASITPGVKRWFCHDCGSPLAATYDYLPDMMYVPLGLLDQAADFPPRLHSHANQCLPWLNIDDGLDREVGSARDKLNARFDLAE